MRIVGYLRVSTEGQSRSGLGLDAQRAAIRSLVSSTSSEVLAEYVEVESGSVADRPELLKAIGHARRAGARLVIARLDRLSRNVRFLAELLESGVEFTCCDVPHATRLTTHILSAVAEDELRRISERTRAALQAARERGVRLGSARPGHWQGREDRRRLGAARGAVASAVARRLAARRGIADLLPRLRELRAAGSLAYVAKTLNDEGHRTPRGCLWTRCAVDRALRLGAAVVV